MTKNTEYYSSENIDRLDATYNMIYGQRGNGKTYCACDKIVDEYLDTGIPSAYIRRFDEMIKPKNIQSLFDPHLEKIKKRTENKYNGIFYRNNAFYLCCYDSVGNKIAQDRNPFCRAYAVNTAETTKGQDAGEVKYIVFDEFITRQFYLNNEFILFQNLLSSIIRNRSGVKIYMLANTVSKYCPYFTEMGLTKIKDQKQGTIEVYTMGKTNTKIAVEYCGKAAVADKVSQYYCFDNPEINMITSGSWEISLYRHIPAGVADNPPILTFYIVFDSITLRAAIYIFNDAPLLTISRQHKEIKNYDTSIVFSDSLDNPPDNNPLHQADFTFLPTRAHNLIVSLIRQKKTYFATNEDGETFSAFLKFAKGGFSV